MKTKLVSSSLLLWLIAFIPTLAQTQDVDVTLERIGPFCPTHLIEGDRDFAGTPKIYIRTDMRISPDGHKLLLNSRFSAREEGGDHTTVDQTFVHTLWTAPEGQRIVSYAVLTGTSNANLRWSEPRQRGYQEWCNDNCAKDQMRQPEFVQQHRVIGDTEGEDISWGGRCDDSSTSYSLALSRFQATCVSENAIQTATNNANYDQKGVIQKGPRKKKD